MTTAMTNEDATMSSYTGPDGIEYSLAHLEPFEVIIDLRVGEEQFQVPLWVVYRNHCYSRDAFGKDVDDEEVMAWQLPEDPRERYPRLFCKDRWTYSHGLPAVVRTVLIQSRCYRTNDRGLYYKFDRASRTQAGSVEGTYLFYRFEANRYNSAGLVLSIESVHYRTTLPQNDRNRQLINFKIALDESLQKHYPEVLNELRKAKGS